MKQIYTKPMAASISLYSEESMMVTTSLNISNEETKNMLVIRRGESHFDEEESE